MRFWISAQDMTTLKNWGGEIESISHLFSGQLTTQLGLPKWDETEQDENTGEILGWWGGGMK